MTNEITEIHVSGGAARSTTFNQIQADVYGKTVLRGISEQSSALGALFVAATSIGLYPDIATAVASGAASDQHSRRTPDEEAHQLYEKMLVLNDELYAALASHDIYEKASQMRELIAARR